MCFSPKFSRSVEHINAPRRPPLRFVASAVQFAMMATAQRHGEFVADLEAKSSGLGESQMVGIAGLPAADHARLFGDKAKVNFVALSAWLGKGQHAFVDCFPGCFRSFFWHRWQLGKIRGRDGLDGRRTGLFVDFGQFALKGLLHQASVVSGEGILGRQTALCPLVELWKACPRPVRLAISRVRRAAEASWSRVGGEGARRRFPSPLAV